MGKGKYSVQWEIIMQAVITKLEWLAWGPATICILLATGVLFSVKTGFFQIIHYKTWMEKTIGKQFRKREAKGEISPFQSACTALAATLGTGNIAGVATALAAGGPGALFWMWISALLGTMTAYAENVLAAVYPGVDGKGNRAGGPMFYIEKGLGCKWLASLFAGLCVCASLGMGNMTQANSIAQSAKLSFGVPPILTGVCLLMLILFAQNGGVKRICKITEKLVPFMALGYAAGTIAIILIRLEMLPSVISMIIKEAFSLQAGLGGITGFGIAAALKTGIARGVCSNEAGLGTSVMANSAAGMNPHEQGMWGIFEVALDTLFMCTLTGLAILCSGVYEVELYASGAENLCNGAALTAGAFYRVVGPVGEIFVTASLTLFAVSTLLGWSYYGTLAAGFILGKPGERIYQLAFLAAIVLGSVQRVESVWKISDIFNGMMALPNLLALLWMRKIVFHVWKQGINGKADTI